MRGLRVKYFIFSILAILSIVSFGFAAWSFASSINQEITGEIIAYDIKNVNEFVNLNTKEYKDEAIESIYYTTDGFTQSNSASNKQVISQMSYYILDTSKFINGTYIEVSFDFSDKVDSFLKSNNYQLNANLYDSNKQVIGKPYTSNKSKLSINLDSNNFSFGNLYYIALELKVMVTNFDNWITSFSDNNPIIDLSITVNSDSTNYWLIAFNTQIYFKETQTINLKWNYSDPYTYDSTEKTVYLESIPEDVNVNYNGEFAETDADEYSANATLKYGKKYIVNIDGNKVANGSTTSLKWKINPKTIYLNSNTNINSAIAIDYTSVKNWNDFKKLISSITFSESTFTDYNVYGISDGTFLYADSNYESMMTNKMNSLGYNSFKTKYEYIPGSTYLGYVVSTNKNYVIDGQDYIYIKYKTAKIGSTYYTIEDALNSSGTGSITMVGNLTTDESKVQITAFSNILEVKEYSNSNHKLIVPYASENTSESYSKIEETNPTSKNVCGCLYIPSSVTYNTTKELYITSQIAGQGQCGDHGAIINDGNMNFNNGSSLYSYGFVKGKGNLVVNSGVTVTDVMNFKDYPGSASTANDLAKTCFPIFAWVLNNISCKTRYMKGATLACFANIYGSHYLVGFKELKVVLIGSSSTEDNCLFVPSSNATPTDYIEKYTNSIECNEKFTYDNQLKVLSDLFINGNYEDKALGVTVYSGLKFESSYSKPLPISYINVSIKTGKLKISQASYIFLQGTTLEVAKEAELVVAGNSIIILDKTGTDALCSYFDKNHAISKTNSLLKLNGTISGTGTIAGTIETTEENAKLQISNYSVGAGMIASKTATSSGTTNQKVISSQYKKYDVNTGLVDSTYTKVSGGEYSSIKVNDTYGWIANKAEIVYDVNGGSPSIDSKIVDLTSSGYTISNLDISMSPTKEYYMFTGWTLNGSDPVGQTIYGGVTLVANYEPINYTIKFHNVDESWNEGMQFNYETDLDMPIPERTDAVFGGWFLEDTFETRVSRLNGKNLVAYVNSNILNLYASWLSQDSKIYTINYDNSNTNGAQCQDSDSIAVNDGFNWSSIKLPDLSKNDNNYTIETYFAGWFDNEGKEVTSLSEDMFDENNTLNLVAKYINKNILMIKVGNLELMTVYYKEGYTFKIPDLTSYSDFKLPENFVFCNQWMLSNGSSITYHNVGATVTLVDQTTLEPDIRQYVSVSIGTNDYTTVNVVLTKDEGYLVENQGNNAIAKVFDGTTKSNGTSFYVTVGSKFSAWYTEVSGGTNYKATITGTDTDNDLKTDPQSYTVTAEVLITPSGEKSCIVEGTLITLADGTKKKVEELEFGDLLLTWNFFKGTFDAKPVIAIEKSIRTKLNILTICLSNGEKLQVVGGQSFFDMLNRQYFEINYLNYLESIGKEIMTIDNDRMSSATITDIYEEIIETVAYEVITAEDFNFVANNILTIEPFIFWTNTFEINENYQYDKEQMEKDIEKYGLYKYEEWSDYLTKEEFEAFNGKYFKVAVGKGLITEEYILEAIKIYLHSYSH